MDIEKLPYYLFLIIRPDGNTAFSRIHEQYPLDLDINELLTLGSNLNNLNTMQAEIIHPDIKNNRKDEIDLAKNSSIKSINASTFQMRFLDTVSGYMFIISAGNGVDFRKLDSKLDQIYKTFVDYVIKAPYFNVKIVIQRPQKKSTTPYFSKNAMKSCIQFDHLYVYSALNTSFLMKHTYGEGYNVIVMSSIQHEDDQEVNIQQSVSKSMWNIERQAAKSFDRLDPPRQIVERAYSLTPDMVGGWKPKKIEKSTNRVPFQIKYHDPTIQLLLKQLKRNANKCKEKLVYIGPLKQCSISLHEGMPYKNPFGNRPRLQLTASWNKLNYRQQIIPVQCQLSFNSDFQCGNLDVAIRVDQNQYDLYMRVDTNTQGHTHWYYFQVKNKNFSGKVKFNICNFRKPTSLYQKGLKPYVKSEKNGAGWTQQGSSIVYTKLKRNYEFISQNKSLIQDKYFALSFMYDFKDFNDNVSFAYCLPYTYSQLLFFVDSLNNVKKMTPLRSLGGLAVPLLKITNEQVEEENKKIAIVTGRVHPGESNGSYVTQGFLECICEDTPLGVKLRNKFIFYVVPMLNPDGVVAGNYRSSLFGKDLNRTYSQTRKFAFPQTYHLIELAKKLKSKHKKRFCLYIDIHGHSSKKNIFMFGPEHSIQTTQYENCRQLPKIFSNLTPYFRYYLCSYRVSGKKMSTARAVFSKKLDVPFSYTMENSNGLFLDHTKKHETQGSIDLLKQMGHMLGKALGQLQLDRKISKALADKLSRKNVVLEADENLQEDSSDDDDDIDESDQDLPIEFLQELENAISDGKSKVSTMVVVNKKPQKPSVVIIEKKQEEQCKLISPQMKQSKSQTKKPTPKNLYLQQEQLQIALMIPKTNFNRKQKLKTQIPRVNNRYRNLGNGADRVSLLPPVMQFRNNPVFLPRLKSKETINKSQHYQSKQIRTIQTSSNKFTRSIVIQDIGLSGEKRKQSKKNIESNNHKLLDTLLQRLKTIK